jgi:hypothetical protein
MTFTHDVFISYAHLDNQELVEGQKGWVANFHRALEIRVGQYLGKEPDIWRDPKLRGNDVFAETLVTKVQASAILISVLSPRYVRSEWTRREVSEFINGARQAPNVGDKSRIFKILKTPVPSDEYPAELRSLLGYEFFKIDPESGRARELNEIFGPGAQCEFWMKVDDVAQDVCSLLRKLEAEKFGIGATPDAEKPPVYVAFTTSDLAEERENLRRDLQQHGYEVLPRQAFGASLNEVESAIREDLRRCRLSVHMVGSRYGVIPEDGAESLPEIQYRLAEESGRTPALARLVWMPADLEIANERQRGFVERLRLAASSGQDADLLETPFDDLRAIVQVRLQDLAVEMPAAENSAAAAAPERVHLYLIYDKRDVDSIAPWADFLFAGGLEVLHPIFEGDETEIREYHEENLRTCDAVLIYYGAANELWLRRKLREIQHIAGLGRNDPFSALGIALGPPSRPEKRHFQTHDALVVPQMDGLSAAEFAPFLAQAGTRRKARAT